MATPSNTDLAKALLFCDPMYKLWDEFDYEAKEVLSSGSFGTVYKIVRYKTGQPYAMKEQKALTTGEIQLRREIFALKLFNSPFIIKLYNSYKMLHSYYLVMDLAENGDLFGHIRDNGPFSFNSTQFFTAEVVLGLEYLRSQRFVHRDIKCKNILLDSAFHAKLTDFGTAKMIGQPQGTSIIAEQIEKNSLTGTFSMLAPEVLKSEPVSFGTDYWNLAFVIFAMYASRSLAYLKGLEPKIVDEYLAYMENCMWRYPYNQPNPVVHDLLYRITRRNPEERLGTINLDDLKAHPFFTGIDWDNIQHMESPGIEKTTASTKGKCLGKDVHIMSHPTAAMAQYSVPTTPTQQSTTSFMSTPPPKPPRTPVLDRSTPPPKPPRTPVLDRSTPPPKPPRTPVLDQSTPPPKPPRTPVLDRSMPPPKPPRTPSLTTSSPRSTPQPTTTSTQQVAPSRPRMGVRSATPTLPRSSEPVASPPATRTVPKMGVLSPASGRPAPKPTLAPRERTPSFIAFEEDPHQRPRSASYLKAVTVGDTMPKSKSSTPPVQEGHQRQRSASYMMAVKSGDTMPRSDNKRMSTLGPAAVAPPALTLLPDAPARLAPLVEMESLLSGQTGGAAASDTDTPVRFVHGTGTPVTPGYATGTQQTPAYTGYNVNTPLSGCEYDPDDSSGSSLDKGSLKKIGHWRGSAQSIHTVWNSELSSPTPERKLKSGPW